MPNRDQRELISTLKQSEKYYDDLIGRASKQKLLNHKKALMAYASRASKIFKEFQHFYNSVWPADIPFVVALYPIPGSKGHTTATPHANNLCVGVLTDETSHIERIGVVLHEIGHVQYDEQAYEFQHEIEN